MSSQAVPHAPRVPPPVGACEARAEAASAWSFNAVYADHFDFVWRTARRLGVPPSLVDDVVQETFLVVHRRLDSFEGRSSIRSWVYGIVSRVVCDCRRTIRRKDPRACGRQPGSESADVDGLPDLSEPDPQEHAERADAVQLLHDLLDELDWPKREVFVLVELEELSVPEAAEALGVNVNTVYSRMRAARRAFNQAVMRRQAREGWRTA